jgi:hypothetical protein
MIFWKEPTIKSSASMLDANVMTFITFLFMVLKISSATVNIHIRIMMLQKKVAKIVHVNLLIPHGLARVVRSFQNMQLFRNVKRKNRQKDKMFTSKTVESFHIVACSVEDSNFSMKLINK